MRALSRRLLAGIGAAALAASLAYADTQAINVTTVGTYPPLTNNGFNYYQPPGGYTFSWNFTLNAPIQVTQLGYYDSGLAGTPEPGGFGSHLVTLFDVTTDTQIASATVTAASPASGVFNYAPITAATLRVSDTYMISGDMTNQYYLVGLNQAAVPAAPEINYQFVPNLNIFGTNAPPGTYSDFGPNFQFATASTCTQNVPGRNVIALAGDQCTAAGTYNPTTTNVPLPVTYNGFGLYANGGTIASSGAVSIATTDPSGAGGSIGAWADGKGSLITLGGATTITTLGANSHGAYATGGGQIISTGPLSATTTGAGAIGLYASGAGSSIVAALGAVSTSAALTPAVQADSGASVRLTGGNVTTTGVGAWGLSANGVGSLISATGVTVTTSGGVDASGNVALGAFARNGATISLTGTTVQTSGGSAHGVEAGGASSITLSGGSVTTGGGSAYGLFSTDANSRIVASNGVAIATSGVAADGVVVISGAGVTLSGGSVATKGAGAIAVYVDGAGSTFTATGVAISTKGGFVPFQAQGVSVGDSATATLTNDTVVTAGAQAHGVVAILAGQVAISGGSVNVSGVDADGLLANGVGSTITTTGDLVVTSTATSSAFVIDGARADNRGALNLSATSITTSGAGVSGVGVATAGSATLNGVTVTTNGDAAHAVLVTDAGSSVTLLGTQNLTTSANGAVGVYAASGGVVTGTGAVNITTSGTNALINGLSSFGVNADGAGSSITLGAATVATSGAGAVGLLASDRNATGAGGTIVVNGPLTVTTQSVFAYDVFANGAGSQIALNGATTLNVGAGAFGLYATGGGVVTTAAGLTINAAQAGFGGAVEADAGSSIALGETSSIHLTGTNLVGLFATGTGVISTKAALTLDAGANPGIVAQGGTINLGGSTAISTSGANATGVKATGGGRVTATNGLAVTTTGAGAMALFATGAQSSISAANVTIATSGASSFGAHANLGGSIVLSGGSVRTAGDGATGLSVVGAGSSLSASNLGVDTTGALDAATGFHAHAIYNGPGASGPSGGNLLLTNVAASTAGAQSAALWTDAGGVSHVTGGSFATTGVDAGAAAVANGGSLTISGATLATTGDGSTGLFINGAGGTVSASNLTISTSGGVWTAGNGSHADGIYNGTFGSHTGGGVMTVTDSIVKTTGEQAHGVSVGEGGTTTFLGGAVATSGADAHAASATRGGSLVIGLDAAGTGTDLRALGTGAYVVSASGGGLIFLTGATLGSTGNGSGGLAVNGVGSEIDAANVTLFTSGGFDPASGLHAYGAANTPFGTFTSGGTLKLTGTQISTFGEGMYGVYTAGMNAGGGGGQGGGGGHGGGGGGFHGGGGGFSSTTTISGGSISTFGTDAHALYAARIGANVTAVGAKLFTYGTGAYGAYVTTGASLALNDGVRVQAFGSGGGGVYVTGVGSNATLSGTVGVQSQAGGSALYADAGGRIAVQGVLGVRAGGAAITANGGSVAAPGSLVIETTSASASALVLSGDNSSFSGTGGGAIAAAGSVVQFLNGSNQSATFVGYTINSAAGDLAFADPSSSTLNFTNSTVNAGGGNLVNATAGSTFTLNASGSTLIGAIATDATSTTNVNLTNASSLTLTGNSTITNLNLNNSALGFAPSTNGVFQTLTVTNFSGTGGALTLNAALGAKPQGADQIVVNGGRATGATLLTIRSFGAPAGSTTGVGVPLVVATNGGSIAPGAFALSGPLVVNGYMYTLQEQSGGDFLVSNTTQTAAQGSASLASLSQTRQTQTITTKLLGSILTGATEQINCASCSSGFASFGSLALGLHGRWTLNDNFAILAGGSYDSFSSQGVSVNNSMQVALALRYDAVQLGKNRPFVEAGVTAQPWASVTYRRAYDSALGGGVGVGTTLSRSVAAYGRLGYIWRLSRADEAAVYGDLTRSWDYTAGYTEGATPGNPNGATVAPTLDMLNVARVGAQYTHLFGQHIEGNLSAGFAQAFGAVYGTSAALGGFGVDTGSAATGFRWWELGGRVSYRFSKTVTGDLFAIGTLGAQPVGNQIHGGLALRMAF